MFCCHDCIVSSTQLFVILLVIGVHLMIQTLPFILLTFVCIGVTIASEFIHGEVNWKIPSNPLLMLKSMACFLLRFGCDCYGVWFLEIVALRSWWSTGLYHENFSYSWMVWSISLFISATIQVWYEMDHFSGFQSFLTRQLVWVDILELLFWRKLCTNEESQDKSS